MWNKIGFWFWVLMVPFACAMGYVNYELNNIWLFWLNALTVVCATFNAYHTRKNILSEEEYQRWLDGKE